MRYLSGLLKLIILKALIIHLATLLAGCAAVQDLILKSTPSNTNFGEIEALPRVRQSIYDLNKSEWPSIRSKTPLLRCPGALFDHRDVKIALRQASRLYKEGQLVGYNKYPHFYGNIEGFEFSASEPYMVFPIKYAEAYNGGIVYQCNSFSCD